MNFRLFALITLFLLPSCAYVIKSQQQEIAFNTIGAEDAVCFIYTERLRYKIHPPQTLVLNKSDEDMTVDCMAPGLRRKKVIVTSHIDDITMLNAANAGAGIPVDYLSQSMFTYPNRIEIDFTGIAPSKQASPQHNNPDTIQPEEYDLDEYLPSQPRLNSDRYAPEIEAWPRRGTQDQMTGGYDEPATYSDKGDLMPVGTVPTNTIPANGAPQNLSGDNGPIMPNAMANPGVEPAPVPSYPGE